MIADGKNLTGSLLSGQKLVGSKVENPRGEGLGKIEDIMISADSGQIAYAVVSFGGVLSLGNKLFAFPWSALRVDSPLKKVILNLDKKTLAKTRGFDKDHWPDPSDWNGGISVPSPSPSMPTVPERAATGVIPDARGEAPRPGVPALNESRAAEPAASVRNGMEHWGKSWQSHGLDRS